MKPQKQTVYLPVSDFHSSERAICTIGIPDLYGDRVIEKEGYFFIPEQLNEYTQNVIKQALETAKNNLRQASGTFNSDYFSQKQSITNTFEETFNKFKV